MTRIWIKYIGFTLTAVGTSQCDKPFYRVVGFYDFLLQGRRGSRSCLRNRMYTERVCQFSMIVFEIHHRLFLGRTIRNSNAGLD